MGTEYAVKVVWLARDKQPSDEGCFAIGGMARLDQR